MLAVPADHELADAQSVGTDVLVGVDVLLPVSYTHLRAHETVLDLVCRLLLEKKKKCKQVFMSMHDYT